MAAIDDLIHDFTTLAKQRDTQAAAGTAAAAESPKSRLMALPLGTRVLDLITGQEGTVIDGRRQNVVIPAAGQSGR